MKMTSAQAAKLLRQWNESLKALQRREENTKGQDSDRRKNRLTLASQLPATPYY